MIVGLEDITEGTLSVDGKVVNDLDPKDRNMAMVFQSYAIYPHMTVRENMAFPLKIAKVPDEEVKRRVDEAAEMLELDRAPRPQARRTSPAASASGSPWAGPSCASPTPSSWTSRCRTSTPSCGCRCAR